MPRAGTSTLGSWQRTPSRGRGPPGDDWNPARFDPTESRRSGPSGGGELVPVWYSGQCQDLLGGTRGQGIAVARRLGRIPRLDDDQHLSGLYLAVQVG